MTREKEIINFYEKDANSYEEERFITKRGKYENSFQKEIVLAMVNSWKDINILDLGCGTGRFSIEVSKWGGIITALDPSLSMLEKLKERIVIGDEVKLVYGNAYKLSFSDNSFDGCICVNVLSHLPNYEKVFAEVQRVLKPNAFFIFNIPNLHSILLPAGILVNLRKKSLINPVYTKWYTLREVKDVLQTTGFKIEILKGVLLPALNPIPLQLVKKLNKLSGNIILKHISTGIFIKAITRKNEL